MKQKLILFSALLIISLLAGTASAIEDAGDTDLVSKDTGLSVVDIEYSGDCPFYKGEDIVEITVTFSEPVMFSEAIVEYDAIEESILMESDSGAMSDTVWCGEYLVPYFVNAPVNVTVHGASLDDEVEVTDYYAFMIDNEAPTFKRIEPSSNPVFTDCVLFEFSAFDMVDREVDYTICIDGIKEAKGKISSTDIVIFEPEMDDGYYQLEITLEDDAGNTATWGPIDLYVDCKDPSVTLISPADFTVITMDDPFLEFNFTAEDTVSADCNLDMYYQLCIDGEPVDEIAGIMTSGEYITATYPGSELSDGVHNWSVSVVDMAGNDCTGKVRNFYVNCFGLDVALVSPDGGYVSANPEFNFSVAGGAGLPFVCELYINNTKVTNDMLNETLFVGEDLTNYYAVTEMVEDAEEIPWTVRIIDCAGNEYMPEPLYFSVDTIAPAAVANLFVADALSETTWYSVYDEPGLFVCWDKNTEEDLYDGADAYYGVPYVVFISDCEPQCGEDIFEEMEVAVPVSTIYETEDEESLFMNIGTYCGEPLVYGKDYWVAVIALDRAGNYDECFAVCGPVQTYEDMTLMLDAGWNLKSVPKTPASFNADPASVFGECTTVIYWDGCDWVFPDCIEPCKGYWVYTPEAGMSNVKFKPMSLDSATPDVPPSLYLAPGWQMIGHTSLVPVSWAETLGSMQTPQGLGIEYKFSNIITYSNNEGWGGTISLGILDLVGAEEYEIPYPVEALQSQGAMVPGQGYWIFMKEEGTYASVESVDFYGAV